MALQNPRDILNEADFVRIQDGIQASEAALALIDLSKQAGIDVSTFEQTAKANRDKLLKIKNTFFPGR